MRFVYADTSTYHWFINLHESFRDDDNHFNLFRNIFHPVTGKIWIMTRPAQLSLQWNAKDIIEHDIFHIHYPLNESALRAEIANLGRTLTNHARTEK